MFITLNYKIWNENYLELFESMLESYHTVEHRSSITPGCYTTQLTQYPFGADDVKI